MTTNTIMAQLIVSDLESSIGFYSAVFGREPDVRPMDGLAEWEFAGAGAIQVFEEPHRAGKSGVTISVSSIEEHIAVMEAAHIAHDHPMDATYVRLCTLADPDGNRIAFTEPLSTREPQLAELAAFLGEWRAQGTSYGGTDQAGTDPRANGVPWTSTHTGRWHTGEFFLVQDERAVPGGATFDTLSIMGADSSTGGYFARTFENHGFYRHYSVSVDAHRWLLTGEKERATVVFSDNDRTQTISWEWKPDTTWLPLCDRVATRTDLAEPGQ